MTPGLVAAVLGLGGLIELACISNQLGAIRRDLRVVRELASIAVVDMTEPTAEMLGEVRRNMTCQPSPDTPTDLVAYKVKRSRKHGRHHGTERDS